jgi:medium-chain acyl-[acyl-carrier-protein] hydrolase
MKQSVWKQSYNINTFLVTPEKRLGLFGLLNLIQDTAWIHATHLGHGYETMLEEQTAWILTRQKLQVSEWARWGDQLELVTWIRPITGLLAIRDFEFHLHGKKVGSCTTQWLIMNLKTRKPAEKLLELSPDKYRQDSVSDLEASKIHLNSSLKELAEFHVRNSDLDLNGHVNNTRYAQWILDSVAYEKHLQFVLNEYEVNFLNETKSGDKIKILGGEVSNDRFQFQGYRSVDNKTVFAATFKVNARQLVPSNNIS